MNKREAAIERAWKAWQAEWLTSPGVEPPQLLTTFIAGYDAGRQPLEKVLRAMFIVNDEMTDISEVSSEEYAEWEARARKAEMAVRALLSEGDSAEAEGSDDGE